jgi:uncharacterized protein with von Willebrand factor type A (vWA) domain
MNQEVFMQENIEKSKQYGMDDNVTEDSMSAMSIFDKEMSNRRDFLKSTLKLSAAAAATLVGAIAVSKIAPNSVMPGGVDIAEAGAGQQTGAQVGAHNVCYHNACYACHVACHHACHHAHRRRRFFW